MNKHINNWGIKGTKTMWHLFKVNSGSISIVQLTHVFLVWSLFSLTPANATDATDFGWKGLGLNKGVFSLAFDPNDANVIYAGTNESGLYRSQDAGESWEHLWGGDGRAVVRAIVIGKESKAIFLGVALGREPGIWTSTDNGATWAKIDTGLGVNYIQALVMHPTNEQVLYAGTGWGVVKTVDGGQTWTHASDGLMDESGDFPWVHEIVFDPANPEILYALTSTAMLHRPPAVPKQDISLLNQSGPPTDYLMSAQVTPNIYKTQNGGLSWQPIQSNIDFAEEALWSVAMSPITPDIFFLGTTKGLLITMDRGNTLVQMDFDFLKRDRALEIVYSPFDSTVFVGTSTSGIFRSIDQGKSWRQIYSFGTLKSKSGIFTILFHPDNQNKVYVGGLHARDIYVKTFVVARVPEDFNEDGAVNFDDFLLFAKHFNLNVDGVVIESLFDLNKNGKIDFPDFLIFVKGFSENN